MILLTSIGRRAIKDNDQEITAILTKPIKPSALFDTLVNIFSGQTMQVVRHEPLPDEHMGQQLPLRILLAEDNATNQKLALRLLQRIGYRADVAANGLEVMGALQRGTYDVVLMDVQMPEMDGLEATRQIRAELPEIVQPYIIAMTANAMQGDREVCLASGMDEYVSKPIRLESLVSALSKGRPLNSGSLSIEPPIGAFSSDVAELDREALHNLLEVLGGEFHYLVEVIDSFLEEAPKLLAELDTALANGEVDTVRRLAHSLKSNSADFGAGVLNKLCSQLEERARSGSLDGAQEMAARVAAEYQRCAVQLVELKKRGNIN